MWKNIQKAIGKPTYIHIYKGVNENGAMEMHRMVKPHLVCIKIR